MEEADELQAMISHIEEKIEVGVQEFRDLESKKKIIEQKLLEARRFNKEVAIMHLSAELFVFNTQIGESGAKIKDLQREAYFINLERKRKTGVVRKLKEEIAEEKRKAALKRQIEEKIKTEVCTFSCIKPYWFA